MEILKTEKAEGGYNVYFKDIDMVAFVHLKEEIEDLKKQGFIKSEKPVKTSVKKGKK
jgi:hypothetical protein